MFETTTAPLLGTTASARRVPDSSFSSWSGEKLFCYFCGDGSSDESPGADRQAPIREEIDRRDQLNGLLQQAYAEHLARGKKQNRYARSA